MDYGFWDERHGEKYLFPDLYSEKGKFKKILLAENLEEITLNLHGLKDFDVYHSNLVEMWLDHFKGLKKIILEGVKSSSGIKRINSALQNVAVSDFKLLIRWEAKRGEVLSWKEPAADGKEARIEG